MVHWVQWTIGYWLICSETCWSSCRRRPRDWDERLSCYHAHRQRVRWNVGNHIEEQTTILRSSTTKCRRSAPKLSLSVLLSQIIIV